MVISTEAEEAVVALFQRLFPGIPSVHLDQVSGKTTVNHYLARKSGCSPSKLAALKTGLEVIRHSGLALGSGKITVSKIRPQDWAESWKNHFRPLRVGRILLVKPSWIHQPPGADEVVVELDPGLSFGTGHHPTTRYCLKEVVRWRPRKMPLSFLDVGTGSGILAVAAAKLGYQPVEAFDFDPVAVRIAKENAKLNGVSGQVRLLRRDLGKWPSAGRRKFDLICANLTEDQLVKRQEPLINSLAKGGRLVLAGIPDRKFSTVAKVYQRAGFNLVKTRREGEWCSGTFTVYI